MNDELGPQKAEFDWDQLTSLEKKGFFLYSKFKDLPTTIEKFKLHGGPSAGRFQIFVPTQKLNLHHFHRRDEP